MIEIPPTANELQVEKIKDVATRFNCWPNDVRILPAVDLPADWIYVRIGEDKDRPYDFGVDPEGIAHS